MCLLTYLPAGIQPDVVALARGAKANSDGHGFAIVIPAQGKAGRILVRKSMKAESLITEFQYLRALYPDGPALFHSRITTDGLTNLYNCHPFMHSRDKRTVIGHNGILPKSVRPGEGDIRSDTRIFAEEAAQHFDLHTVMGRQLAGEWMGTYNKLVILSVDPAYDEYGYIINEAEGEWHQGIWYSNSSYTGFRYSAYTGGYTYSTKRWEVCANRYCPAGKQKIATVSPWSLVCKRCNECSVCGADPCMCVLVSEEHWEGKEGKGATVTVIGGSPKSGATVSGSASEDRSAAYAASVAEYRQALEEAHRASQGWEDPDDEYGDGYGPGRLEEVLALVDTMNNGGEVTDLDTIVADLEAGDVGWPPDEDGSLIKSGDPNDDQDYLIYEGVKYAIN